MSSPARSTGKTAIGRRLTWLGVVTSGASLLVASFSFMVFEATTARERVASRSALLAEVTAANSAAAVYFDDSDAALEALAALAADRSLDVACVYGLDGTPVARFVPDSRVALDCPPAREPSVAFARGRVRVFRPVLLGDELVGSIHLQLEADSVGQRLSGYAAIGGGVLATSVLLSLLLSAPLKRRIVQPLTALIASSESIASGDLTTTPPVDGDDEIGVLGRAFGMMSQGLHDVVSRVMGSASSVRDVTGDLGTAIARLREASASETEAMEQVHGSTQRTALSAQNLNQRAEPLSSAIDQIAQEVSRLDASSAHVSERMDSLGGTVEENVSSVDQLKASSQSIGASIEQLRSSTLSTTESLGEIESTADQARGLARTAHDLTQEMLEASRGGRSSVGSRS